MLRVFIINHVNYGKPRVTYFKMVPLRDRTIESFIQTCEEKTDFYKRLSKVHLKFIEAMIVLNLIV